MLPLAGAEITTFLAPAVMCWPAPSSSTKRPVDSSTMSMPMSPHGSFLGSRSARAVMRWPSTVRLSSSYSTVPGKRPCTESYLSRWARVWLSVRSLMATTSTSSRPSRALNVRRPMRPNPLMATLVLAIGEKGVVGPARWRGRGYGVRRGEGKAPGLLRQINQQPGATVFSSLYVRPRNLPSCLV